MFPMVSQTMRAFINSSHQNSGLIK